MRVLYVNHTGEFSGAEHSLLVLLSALPDNVHAEVACPDGKLARAVGSMGITVHRIAAIGGGPRVGVTGLWTVASQLASCSREIAHLCRSRGFDVVHANSVRASLSSCIARTCGGAPVVAHVRDVLGREEALSYSVLRLIGAGARGVIANSEYTRQNLPRTPRRRAIVVHNAVDAATFSPAVTTRVAARRHLGLATDDFVLVVAGQMTPWKAQDDAVRTVHELGSTGRRVRLLLAGSAKFTDPGARYDHASYAHFVRRLVEELQLGDRISLLGERHDMPTILAAADVLLLPSWREPFGRVVIEAMAMELPVVATNEGGPREIIRDGIDGLLIEPRNPRAWAGAVAMLMDDAPLRRAMGRNGRRQAELRFGPAEHARAVTAYYESTGRAGRRIRAPRLEACERRATGMNRGTRTR